MKNSFFYLLILILINACSKNKEYNFKVIESFPIDQKIISEVVDLDSIPNCPNSIFIIGKYLVMHSRTCDKKLFHAYDKSSFQIIGSFGTIGKGPNELLDPSPTGQVVANDTIAGIWIISGSSLNHDLINIEKSLESSQFIISKSFKLPETEGVGYGYYVEEDSVVVNSYAGEKGRFYTRNLKTEDTKWVGFIPKVTAEKSSLTVGDKSDLYYAVHTLTNENKFFVLGLTEAKRIDVFNNKLEHHVSVLYTDSPKKVNLNNNGAESGDRLWRIYGGHNFIYILYNNWSLDGEKRVTYPEIHIFSLDGNAVALYKLDVNKFIDDFTVDEENNSLFFLTNDEEGFPQIRQYRIQDLNQTPI